MTMVLGWRMLGVAYILRELRGALVYHGPQSFWAAVQHEHHGGHSSVQLSVQPSPLQKVSIKLCFWCVYTTLILKD